MHYAFGLEVWRHSSSDQSAQSFGYYQGAFRRHDWFDGDGTISNTIEPVASDLKTD